MNRLQQICIVMAMMLGTATKRAFPAEFMAGVAAVDITPPLGLPLAGYYHERLADGVLDPLFAKALVIRSGNDHAVVVALDLIEVPVNVTERTRQRIEKSTGIKPHHVMIAATHTHTGPVLAKEDTYNEAYGGLKPPSIQYTEHLPELIEEAIKTALLRLQPVKLNIARGKCDGLAFNRRYFMRDGTVGWNPGKLNPNIMMPAGPTDPEVRMLSVTPADASFPAQCLATYVNFAMHTDTTGGNKYSADWPGALDRTLAGWFGTNHITLLGNGTCGNINHVD
ncbi:MAG: neutral/alkaline non-lysosomal ceramidase N-terminal domain-containing protein, partial [Verrucomicrobiae bacterium]|nr:neutral/alkaline non-lysosomal ceramidase N-terminal domain-containing protein [Verrucomicrobiae bacterium]